MEFKVPNLQSIFKALSDVESKLKTASLTEKDKLIYEFQIYNLINFLQEVVLKAYKFDKQEFLAKLVKETNVSGLTCKINSVTFSVESTESTSYSLNKSVYSSNQTDFVRDCIKSGKTIPDFFNVYTKHKVAPQELASINLDELLVTVSKTKSSFVKYPNDFVEEKVLKNNIIRKEE